MCRELVAKFLNMFKNFMQFFSPKYFTRLSRDCYPSVANLSPRNFEELTMGNFCDTHTKVSYNSRTTVLSKHVNISRLSGEKIKLSNIGMNVMRHKCLVTVVRMKMKIS